MKKIILVLGFVSLVAMTFVSCSSSRRNRTGCQASAGILHYNIVMPPMDWIDLASEEEYSQIKQRSNSRPQVIFKHSTRCSISSMAKHRLEQAFAPGEMDFYHLDILRHRNL